MDLKDIERVRRFNRLVTKRVGALQESYLKRGRPLGEARVLYEIGREGADLRRLRSALGLDSGYLSRLLRSLEGQGLIELDASKQDSRRRRATLTRKGRAEVSAYDRLSDQLARSMLAPLNESDRARLLAAMGEVERLIRLSSLEIHLEPPGSDDLFWCLRRYFAELDERFEFGFTIAEEEIVEEANISPPEGFVFLARMDGAPAGCGTLKRIDESTGEIKRVWTAPFARGLGVARRLLETLEEVAKANGLSRIRLDTNRALPEAHALYRKLGYAEVERFSDNVYAHHWFAKEI